MATETRWAASHLAGGVSSPANAVGATDGSWTADSGNTNWTSRWAMDNPTGELTGTQTVRVLARKNSSGGNDPTVTGVSLYENGVLVAEIVGSTSITSASGQTLSGTFDASAITNQNDVEIEIATSGAGGSPSSRRAVQVDSIEWVVSYSLGSRTGTLAGTDTADSAAFSGTVAIAGSFSAAGGVDTVSFGGGVALVGALDGTGSADSAVFAGSVGDPSVSGSFIATETADAVVLAGGVVVSGGYTSAETGDAAEFVGGLAWPDIGGSLSFVDDLDVAAFTGLAIIAGSFDLTDIGDTASFSAKSKRKCTPGAWRRRTMRLISR